MQTGSAERTPIGSESRARTCDPLINSQLLCQLSYLGRRYEDSKGLPSLLLQKLLQTLAAHRVAQLGQGLRLDLANAFAGDAELLADVFQRAGLAIIEAEPHAHDL